LVPCLNGDPSLAELIARLARGETNLGVDMLSS